MCFSSPGICLCFSKFPVTKKELHRTEILHLFLACFHFQQHGTSSTQFKCKFCLPSVISTYFQIWVFLCIYWPRTKVVLKCCVFSCQITLLLYFIWILDKANTGNTKAWPKVYKNSFLQILLCNHIMKKDKTQLCTWIFCLLRI